VIIVSYDTEDKVRREMEEILQSNKNYQVKLVDLLPGKVS